METGICQCLIVVGAFVAVILVLSIQQEKDFQNTVNNQLKLRQERAREEFLGPIYKEEAVINNLAFNMAYNLDRKAILRDGVMDADELRDFWNDAYAALLVCPRGDYIATYQASKVLTTPRGPYVHLAVLDPKTGSGLYTINQTYTKAFVALTKFPIPVFNSTYVYPTTVENFSSTTVLNPDFPLTNPREWSPAGAILNPDTKQVTLSQAYTVSFYNSPRTDWPNNVTLHGVMIIVNMTAAVPMVQNSAVSPDSVAFLVENRQHSLLGGQMPFFAYDRDKGEPYYLPRTPDPIMNNAFIEVDKRCGANFESACDSTVFRMKEEKEEYIVSAVRIQTDSKLNLLLIQYTKRSFFFDVFEANRARGIAIGVVAAVVVIVSSVLIWLAIVRPIRHLQDQMGQAAMMRNQEAADAACKQGGSVLREMDILHISFVAMNNKLLQARPYLPQALLVSHGGSSNEELRNDQYDNTDDEGADDEGLEDDNCRSLDVTSNGTMGMMMKGADVSPNDQPDILSGSRSPSMSVNEDAAMETVPSTWRGAHSTFDNTPTTLSAGGVAPTSRQAHVSDMIVSATTRRMAALVINAHGFHMATQTLSVPETGRLVASLVTAVEIAVRNERGIVDSFHGDHFTISFNTARQVGAALKNAAICALQVESAVRRQTPFKRVSMGLAGGRAMVGNMGNSSMMKLCALGPAYGQATLLEMIAQSNLRRFGQETGCCLISESSAREVEAYVGSHTVGWMKQANKAHPKAKSANSYQAPLVLNILNAVVATRNEEWMYAITKDSSSKNEGAVDDASMEEVHRVADLLSSQVNKCIRHGMKAHCAGSVVNGGGAGDVSSNHSRMSPEDEGLGAIPDFSDTHHINNGSRSTSILGNSTTNITPFSTKYNSLRNKALEVADVVAPTIRQKYKESCQRLASSSNAVIPEMRSLLLGNDSDSEGSMSPQLQDDSQSIRSDVTFNGGSFSPLMLPIGSSSRPGPSTSPHHGGITNAELLSRNPVETGIIGDTKSMSGSALIEMHRVNVPHHEVSSFALNSDCDPICPLRGNRSNTTTPRLNTSGVQTFGVLQPLQLHKSNITSTTRRPFHFSSYRGLSHSERYILQSVDLLEFATSYMEVADALKLQVLSK